MALIDQINRELACAFAQAGYANAQATAIPSQRPELADYQCNAAMPLARAAGVSPRDLALRVSEYLPRDGILLSDVSVAGAGFINLRVSDIALGDAVGNLLNDPRQGLDLGSVTPRRIVLDFSGPNVAKEMLAYHVRSTVLGDSLQRILRFAGHHVTSDVHFGDWGTPMGMIIAELEREQPELPYFDIGIVEGYPKSPPVDIEELSALYRRASARCKDDETARRQARVATADLQAKRPGYMALWQHFRSVTFAAVQRNYARLDVSFDLWLGESDVADLTAGLMERLAAGHIALRSEGALVIPSDDPAAPPLILEKTDGGYTYGATDLATIVHRQQNLAPDLMLYVVDGRQSQHFEQVFDAARKAKLAPGVEFRHLPFGTINGKDGKPFKTRSGGIIRLEDLLDFAHGKALEELPLRSETGGDDFDNLAAQISVAAIKFQDLRNHRQSDYVFDADSFARFEGKTGPYLQYAVVRCNAILAKAGDVPEAGPVPVASKAERALAMHLLAFPSSVEAALTKYEPSAIAEHAYAVAQAYSSFYAECPVLNEADRALRNGRLRLVAITRQDLTLCLNLLGIQAPQSMPARSLQPISVPKEPKAPAACP